MSRLEAICCCYSFLPRIRGGGGGTSNTGEMGPVFADLRALLEKKKEHLGSGQPTMPLLSAHRKPPGLVLGSRFFKAFPGFVFLLQKLVQTQLVKYFPLPREVLLFLTGGSSTAKRYLGGKRLPATPAATKPADFKDFSRSHHKSVPIPPKNTSPKIHRHLFATPTGSHGP